MRGKGCWLCSRLKQLQLGAHGRGRHLSQAAPHHPAAGADWRAPTDANLTTVPQNCQGFPGEEGDGVGFFLIFVNDFTFVSFFSPPCWLHHMACAILVPQPGDRTCTPHSGSTESEPTGSPAKSQGGLLGGTKESPGNNPSPAWKTGQRVGNTRKQDIRDVVAGPVGLLVEL